MRSVCFFFLMMLRPPRPTQSRSSAASDVYKRQGPADGELLIETDGDNLGASHIVTGRPAGNAFKVPALRDVTQTAPYFHDGSEPSLEHAVRLMADHQLGRELSGADTKSIVVWLGALTGELPSAYIAKPELPASTRKTPRPTRMNSFRATPSM